MKVKVYYPSGFTFQLEGRWLGPAEVGGLMVVAMIMGIKEVNLFDPRGVCQAVETGEILYSPRKINQPDKWVRDWLSEHPEWPQILELT